MIRSPRPLTEVNFPWVFFLTSQKPSTLSDHVILFDKLEHYGIRGLALDRIRSYFSNRKQYVEYNGHRSLRNEISCAVPLGSFLGPLFFLLYIDDINNVSNLLNLILFADDNNSLTMYSCHIKIRTIFQLC